MEKESLPKITNLLVTEDDPVIKRFYQQALHDCCRNLTVTDSPEEAIGLLKSQEVDFLITDLKIAEKGGIDIIESAIEFRPQISIIVASGYVFDQEYQEKLQSCANIKGLLQKPFTLETLLGKISAVINDGDSHQN